MQGGRCAETRAMQNGRPEQTMEIDDVLAEEVMQFGFAGRIASGIQELVEIKAFAFAKGLEA